MNRFEIMKPFDLKTWQENPGIKVVTRDGNDVTGLTYYENPTEFKLVGIVGDFDYPSSWMLDGSILRTGKDQYYDLMFADDLQPKLRPWKPEEVPLPVCWIRPTGNRKCRLITVIDSLSVELDFGVIHYPRLLSDYEHTTDGKTWLPCGVVE